MIDLQPIKDRAQKAEDEMDRLTAGSPGTLWRWSIPANPDRDSDLILSASAADVRKLLTAVEAIQTYMQDSLRVDASAADDVQDIITEALA